MELDHIAVSAATLEEGIAPVSYTHLDVYKRQVYGSASPSRARRVLSYIEERGLIVCHVDFRGQRTLALPALGVETAPGLAQPRTAGMPRSARG